MDGQNKLRERKLPKYEIRTGPWAIVGHSTELGKLERMNAGTIG